MAQTPQPGFLAAWINAFTTFDEAHGFAVNLFAVVALALIGAAFLTGRRRLVRPALVAFIVLCLADWVLIEDFGFFGGLGTDPNSMIPFVLLAVGGYLALTRAPAVAAEPAAPGSVRAGGRCGADSGLAGPGPAGRRAALGGGGELRTIASVGAVGLIILGAAPMAAAQASPVADTILAQAHRHSARRRTTSRPGLSAHRPARPDSKPGEPARQGGAADLPGPGVHHATAR